MDNGDIVSGSRYVCMCACTGVSVIYIVTVFSDSVARVFTASDERRASQQHLEVMTAIIHVWLWLLNFLLFTLEFQ